MNIVDPMHNMFLGTAKRMFKTVWVEEELLNLKHLETIQTRVDNILVPPTVGRIPRKISSQFSSFTADEWKNWITLYSIICLRDILPSEHLECWRHFVLACRYLCKRSISLTDIKIIDALLMQFRKLCMGSSASHQICTCMHICKNV